MGSRKADRRGRKIERRIREIGNDLREDFYRIRDLLNEAQSSESTKYLAVGEVINRVRSERDKHGPRAVETLAELLGLKKSSLYGWANVVTTFGREAAEAYLARKDGVRGMHLTMSHLLVAAKVEDSTEREQLLERTLASGWSVRQMQAQVPRKRSAGDKSQSTTPAARAAATVDKFLATTQKWDQTLHGRLEKIKPDEALLEDAGELDEALAELVGVAEAHRQKLQQWLEEAPKALAARAVHTATGDREEASPVARISGSGGDIPDVWNRAESELPAARPACA